DVCSSDLDQRYIRNAALAQIAGKAGRRFVVVFKEGRIGIDRATEALADNKLGLGPFQVRMEFCALGTLHAVVGPKRLRAVGHLDGAERIGARMRGSKT